MRLLQFYAIPQNTAPSRYLFPTITDTLTIFLHVSGDQVSVEDTISFEFYMKDDEDPFFKQDSVLLIDDPSLEHKTNLSGEYIFYVKFDYTDFKKFGEMTIKLLINDKPQTLYSTMFIQDGKKDGTTR